MERVINLLHDIEEKANEIIKRANEEKLKLHTKLQQDMEKYDQEIAKKNEAKLEQLKIKVDKELNQEKQSLVDDCIKQIAKLEADYLDRHSQLAEELFQQIINS